MNTKNYTKALALAALILCLLPSSAIAREPQSVLINAWNGSNFQCQIRPESSPPVVENDLIKFRVTVKGGTGPFTWRLPLYKVKQGDNDVALARIGTVSLDEKRSFVLDMNIADLEKLEKKDMTIRLQSHERFEAICSTPATNIQQLAASVPPKEFKIIEGSLVR